MLGEIQHTFRASPPLELLFLVVFLLLLSTLMFVWQVRRWTTHRGWRDLLDWSRQHDFHLSRPARPAGEPLDRMMGQMRREGADAGAEAITEGQGPTVLTQLEHEAVSLMQVESQMGDEPRRWHVLRRQIQTAWPATGLRPASAASSLIDQFALTAYPRMGESDQFTVHGEDARAARGLSESPARALLPRDIGLLLHGRYLLLDFSTRPFDGIELGRMLALSEQIEQRLPVA